MTEITSRERVRISLRHEEPDRVPTALWGGPYSLVDTFYLKLVEHLGLDEPAPPFRKGHNVSFIDDRVLELLGTDTRYVWPGQSPSSPATPTGEPDRLLDGFGQTWIYRDPYYFAGEPLLAGAGIADIERRVSWPDVSDPRWVAGVAERARQLSEGTDKYVIARMVTSHGPYTLAGNLRGGGQFLIDMGEDPDFVLALVERATDLIEGLMKNYLSACGPYIDMIELPGDDYATAKGLIFSPRMFRRYIRPSIQRLIDVVKNYRSDIRVMLHCDGALEPLLADFIEMGVDVVHPLEPVASMDLVVIKARYGERLSFLGGIDIVHALPGSREDVVAEVKTRLRQLAPGGGYVLAPANHVQADVPLENLITLYESARRYGQYPIQVED